MNMRQSVRLARSPGSEGNVTAKTGAEPDGEVSMAAQRRQPFSKRMISWLNSGEKYDRFLVFIICEIFIGFLIQVAVLYIIVEYSLRGV